MSFLWSHLRRDHLLVRRRLIVEFVVMVDADAGETMPEGSGSLAAGRITRFPLEAARALFDLSTMTSLPATFSSSKRHKALADSHCIFAEVGTKLE